MFILAVLNARSFTCYLHSVRPNGALNYLIKHRKLYMSHVNTVSDRAKIKFFRSRSWWFTVLIWFPSFLVKGLIRYSSLLKTAALPVSQPRLQRTLAMSIPDSKTLERTCGPCTHNREAGLTGATVSRNSRKQHCPQRPNDWRELQPALG